MKNLKNKKGFTLIELLAVIVVLGIILAIAIPLVTGSINDSKKGSFKSSAQMVLREVENEDIMAANLDGVANGAEEAGTTAAKKSLEGYDITKLGINETDFNKSNSYAWKDDSNKYHILLCAKTGGKFEGMGTHVNFASGDNNSASITEPSTISTADTTTGDCVYASK